MATYVPPTMSGAQAYPDKPEKAQAIEDERNERLERETKVPTTPAPAPPPGLKPNEILSWASAGGAPASPLPTEPVPSTQPEVPPGGEGKDENSTNENNKDENSDKAE